MTPSRSKALEDYLREIREDVSGFEEVDFSDINACSIAGENALHRATLNSEDSDVAIAKELIELGIDVNRVANGDLDMTPLHWAVRKGNHAMIELLLDSGANLFAIGGVSHKPPFESAVFNKQDDVVELLFKRVFGVKAEGSTDPQILQSWIKFHEKQAQRLREQSDASPGD